MKLTPMRKSILILLACVVVVAGGVVAWRYWQKTEPRRAAIRSLGKLDAALRAGPATNLLEQLLLPQALATKTVDEQADFVRKALADEVSSEGIKVLQKEGQFGPLMAIFPAEAERWATQAGVKADDCVAFLAERNGIRAEVVLMRQGDAWRILRVNNIKQLALPPGG